MSLDIVVAGLIVGLLVGLTGGLETGVTTSIVAGSIPGVIAGAWLSSHASNMLLRPIIAFVLTASGLKLFGMSATALAITMGIVALAGLPAWAFIDGWARPDAAWRAAGHRRRRTLSLVSLGTPAGVGFVAAAVYFARQRPRILRASAENARMAWEPAYAAGARQQPDDPGGEHERPGGLSVRLPHAARRQAALTGARAVITVSSADQVLSFIQFSDGIDRKKAILKPDAAAGGTCGCTRQQRDTASLAEGP